MPNDQATLESADSRLTTLLPLAAIGTTVVLWASAFVAIRHLGQDLSGGPLALGRLVVASLVLGVFVVIGARRPSSGGWPRRALWPRLLICGVLWFGFYNVALNEGERRIDAGTAAMVIGIGPIVMAVLAGFLLREGFPRPLVIGCAVAFAGVLVIGWSTRTGEGADLLGVLLCVAAAVAYAIAVIAQKPLLGEVSALRVTWLACLIGTVVCLPYGPQLVEQLRAADASTLWWTVYLGVFPTALAFTTWAYALARTSAGKLGATTYLVPPLTILMGWVLIGEAPAWLAVAGGAVSLAGVFLSRRRGR